MHSMKSPGWDERFVDSVLGINNTIRSSEPPKHATTLIFTFIHKNNEKPTPQPGSLKPHRLPGGLVGG